MPRLDTKTDMLVQVVGIILPILFLVVSITFHVELRYRVYLVGAPIFYGIIVAWLLFGILVFLQPARELHAKYKRLLVYQGFVALFLLLIPGAATAMTCTWSLFILAGFAYVGLRGYFVAIAALIGVAVIDGLVAPHEIGSVIVVVVVTIAIGSVVDVVAHQNNFYRYALGATREQAMMQRDRILTIVNNLATAIIATDSQGRIQLYNAASLQLLDVNIGLRGKVVDTIIHVTDKHDNPVSLVALLQAATGVESREDLQMEVSGERIWLSATFSPIHATNDKSTDSDGYVILLRDITRQKSLDEERDEFISVVSHELRTPITVAEGALSNLQLMIGRGTIPTDTLVNHLGAAYKQIVFLAKLVNDLSTLARAERGVADHVECIDVRSLMNELDREYQPQAAKKSLAFIVTVEAGAEYVEASELYLKELLQNIITNALKYTKQGSIELTARYRDDVITFAVQDTGIGIRKADQPHVFDRFWRSEDYRTRETGGTGLGMYVATKLAKRMGTEIGLKSRLNHGSTFWFELPSCQPTESLRQKSYDGNKEAEVSNEIPPQISKTSAQ